jgi:hypothetical protein
MAILSFSVKLPLEHIPACGGEQPAASSSQNLPNQAIYRSGRRDRRRLSLVAPGLQPVLTMRVLAVKYGRPYIGENGSAEGKFDENSDHLQPRTVRQH